MKGPTIVVTRYCYHCDFYKSESYRVQGESERSVYCEHPDFSIRKYIGYSDWTTPRWCPEWENQHD